MADGFVFRPVNRGGEFQSAGLSEKVVWQLRKAYAATTDVPGIAPHDLRRTCAKLCPSAGGELEQIQLLLGHTSFRLQNGTWAPNKLRNRQRAGHHSAAGRPSRRHRNEVAFTVARASRILVHASFPPYAATSETASGPPWCVALESEWRRTSPLLQT